MTFPRKIYQAICDADLYGPVTEDPEESGFSGKKLIGALQRLCRVQLDDSVCYLEVGVFQGLTLLSAARAAPEYPVFGIDNFCKHDPRGTNRSIVESRIQSRGLNHVHLIDKDFEEALENLGSLIQGRKIGVYFVDGPHDYRSQFLCLELARPFFAEHAVLVIDDSNYSHVRQATRDFLIIHPDFKLLFEAYTECHPNNMSARQKETAKNGWWNGVNILLRDPDNLLAPMYPPTLKNREFFYNDHGIHSDRYAACSAEGLRFGSCLLSGHLLRAGKEFCKFYLRSRKIPPEERGPFLQLNTFLPATPVSRYNPFLMSNEHPDAS